MKTSIIVRFKVEGTHRWSTCDIEEVKYLQYPHRHQFHIIAKKKVTHDDRDIEFIQLSHQIYDHLYQKYHHPLEKIFWFGAMSCEMIAKEILETFHLDSCEVNEDGEGGAIVEI